jgi:endo-1,4-beta-xylanase
MSAPDLSHRFQEISLKLSAPDGTPLTDGPVTVEQTRHAFGLGNI